MTTFLVSKGEDTFIDLDDTEPYDRALKKYFEDGGAPDQFVMIPSWCRGGLEKIDGKEYAIFANVHGLLAIYEFDEDGNPVEVECDDERMTSQEQPLCKHLLESELLKVDEDGYIVEPI